jgi:peptidyl-prolyl cis-trans isomerase SurA
LLALALLPLAARAAEDDAGAGRMLRVNRIAAVVNGEIITMHDLRQHSSGEFMRARIDPRAPGASAEMNKIMSRVLTAMVDDILLRQEAERLKIKVTDAEVENEIRMIRQRNQVNEKDFERLLAAQGGSITMLKDRVRNNILSQRILAIMIARKIIISPEEVKTYYEEHQNAFSADKSVDISLIVFPPSVKAQAVVGRIRSGGLAFAAAARQSLGPVPEAGGRLGGIRWDDLAPPIKAAVQDLPAGELSDLFKLDGHDAVVLVNAVSHGRPMTLEEATPEIERVLREPRLQERFDEYMQQLRSRAVIDIRT